MLSELQLGEFIYEQPAVGDIEYIFKHALTHDVAYHSVLNERRRMLHGRIGAALESIYAESLDDHVAELAHHYARSGNPGKGGGILPACCPAVRRPRLIMPKRSRNSRPGSNSCRSCPMTTGAPSWSWTSGTQSVTH